MSKKRGGKKMSNSSASSKVYNFSEKLSKKNSSKPNLKNKPIRFSEMSEKDRKESIEAMREE